MRREKRDRERERYHTCSREFPCALGEGRREETEGERVVIIPQLYDQTNQQPLSFMDKRTTVNINCYQVCSIIT